MELNEYAEAFKTVRVSRDGQGVLLLELHSRGESMTWNALAHRELPALLSAVRRDDANRAVILTGVGESFIRTPEGYGEVYRSGKVKPSDWERGTWEAIGMLKGLLDLQVPVIAALNGPVTGHAELPLLADIVLCTEDTYFQDAAHLPNGLVPGDGVQIIWPMLLGPNRARYFLLCSEKIAAHEARSLGLVAEVVPRDAMLARARELAALLLTQDPLVLRYTRELLLRPLRRAFQEELNLGLAVEAYVSISQFPAFRGEP